MRDDVMDRHEPPASGLRAREVPGDVGADGVATLDAPGPALRGERPLEHAARREEAGVCARVVGEQRLDCAVKDLSGYHHDVGLASGYNRSRHSGSLNLYGVATPVVKPCPARPSAPTPPETATGSSTPRRRCLGMGEPTPLPRRFAARAGVGVGTVFRHFPTKAELLEAVLDRMFERLTDAARRGLEESDPGEAFFRALMHLVDGAAAKKAVADALSSAGVDLRKRTWAGPLRTALSDLLARAQAAGGVRSDMGVAELMAVVVAASRAAEYAGKDKTLRRRCTALVLDGLRWR